MPEMDGGMNATDNDNRDGLRSADEAFMRRCLAVAANGRGYVSPNPMVGCLVVHNGSIIAEGYHRRYGGPHAEVEAIENARERGLSHLFPESTLYVSLEPCSHYGKQPPCAVKVAESGFRRVVVACGDPNPAVSGRGIALLREKGIDVTTGVLADEARFLNRRFMTYIGLKRPYVILKWAQSADGFIAPPGGCAPCAVTDARLQVENHKLRAQEDAVWVGTHTLLTDDPRLDPRAYYGRPPLRVAMDFRGGLPLSLHVFDGSQPTMLFTTEALAAGEYAALQARVNLVPVPATEAARPWAFVLSRLAAAGVGSVVVEGGARLLRQLMAADCYDEIRVFESACRMETGYAAPDLPAGLCVYRPDLVYPATAAFPVAQRIRHYVRAALGGAGLTDGRRYPEDGLGLREEAAEVTL